MDWGPADQRQVGVRQIIKVHRYVPCMEHGHVVVSAKRWVLSEVSKMNKTLLVVELLGCGLCSLR
jgi:hypothetical protein